MGHKLQTIVFAHQPQNTLTILPEKVLGMDFAVRLIQNQMTEVTLYTPLKNHTEQLLQHYFSYIFAVLSRYLTQKEKMYKYFVKNGILYRKTLVQNLQSSLSCFTRKGCHVPQCLSRSTEGGRSPWQLGRASSSCFENICVFDLKMIQSKLHNLCKIFKKKCRRPFSRGKAPCLLPLCKEKALGFLSGGRAGSSGPLFSVCSVLMSPSLLWDASAQHRHLRELGRSWCRLQGEAWVTSIDRTF